MKATAKGSSSSRSASNRSSSNPSSSKAALRREQRAAEIRSRKKKNLIVGITASLLVIGALIGLVVALGTGSSGAKVAIGSPAPNGSFTIQSASGESSATVHSLRGKPTLLWFVTTWCSSCQAGTQAMAQNIQKFAADGVRVVELENANNLGGHGPDINSFGQQLAGASFSNPDWTWGVASEGLTNTYNPRGYLDILYLIDSSGRITYLGGSPASTMSQLLSKAAAVT